MIAVRRLLVAAVALLVVTAALASCGSGSSSSSAALDVVATTTQLADFARNVGGDRVAVKQLLQPNVDPHGYEPTPGDVTGVASADVLVEHGIGLDAWLGGVVDNAGGAPRRVVATAGVPLIMLAEQRARELRAAALQRQRVQLANRQSSTSTSAAPVAGGGITVSRPGSARNARAAQIALQYLGVPYVWGGASPSGFDCSGLASYAYAKVGVSVPRWIPAIWSRFPRVVGSLQPGDMVFFHGLGHMGIYIGGGQMVHAPHTGDVVRIVSMAAMAGWGGYVGAVRPSGLTGK